MATDTIAPFKSEQELQNANLDRSVDPLTMVRGIMGKNGSQSWEYLSSNANHLLVSGSIVTTTAPLSADSSKVSAIQGDAGLLHTSAYASDAGLFRVSAIGGTSRDGTIVDGTTQTISATLTPVSAKPGSTIQGLVINANVTDANQMHVSTVQGDAGLLHVSAYMASIDTTNNVEKVEQQMNYYYMSALGIQTVKATPGILHTLTVNTRGTGSSIKLFDNTSAASGLQIANVDTTLTTTAFVYDAKFTTGLTISTAGASQADLTVTYR